MAQIIKYEKGGPTKRYGTFTIDNNQYQVDDDFIQQLTEYGKTLNPKVGQQFNNIIKAVKSGEDLVFDSVGLGRLEGNAYFNVTDKQTDRLQNERSTIGSIFGSIWGGKEQNARRAISALKNFKYNKPQQSKNQYNWSDKIDVEYERDENGNYKVVNGNKVFINGANNIRALNRLDSLHKILNYKDDDIFVGYNDLGKEAYINLYNRLGEKGVKELRNRIETGTWTEADKLALDDIGIMLDNNRAEGNGTNSTHSTSSQQVEESKYNKVGINFNHRNIFNVDDAGNITIADQELNNIIGNNDVWLNDEFKRRYGAYSDYIPDTSGIFVINGKVYKGDNLDSLSKVQKFLDFVSENRKTAGNSQLIKQYWDDTRTRSPWYNTTVDNKGNLKWSPYFKPNRYVADVTGNYIRKAGDPLIYDYFPNYNYNDITQFDSYGHPLRSLAERVYIDPITKQRVEFNGSLQEQLDPNLIDSYYENATETAFNPYYTIGSKGGYQEIASVGDISNPNTKAALYYNPETKDYYYYDENPGNDDLILNSSLSSGFDKMRDYYWNIDPRLGQYIQSHPEVLKDESVKKLIGETIRNPYLGYISGRRQTDFTPIMLKYPELYKLLQELYKSQTLKSGKNYKTFSGYGGNKELREIKSPSELESRGLAYRVHKEGGILKHQIGGTASNRGNTSRASVQNTQQSDKKLRSAGQDKVIGDSTALTSTDKAELAALVADAASLGATFVPVWGNIAGAGIGAVGSLTGFTADVRRDGLDWGDVGNLAINLGLDAATLVPGLGTGAKASKVVKALKNSKALAKAIKYASTTLSLGAAAQGLQTSWSNIQDGTWTIKDIRNILNGIRGIANVGRLKGSSKSKQTTSDTVTLKPNSKELPEIKLNRSELDNIQEAPKNSKLDKIEELIISKLPKDTKTDDITDILSKYGIKKSSNIDWNWKKPLNVSHNKTVNTKQFKYDEIEGEYLNPTNLNWWNWNRRAAIRDAKTNPNNPYFRPFHWKTNNVEDLNLSHPITRPIYSNFMPDLGIFSTRPKLRDEYNFANQTTFYKKGGKIYKAQGGAGTINWDIKGWLKNNIKPDMILNNLDFISSSKAINKINKKTGEAIHKGMIGSQQSAPQEIYPQFSDNGINRLYDERIKDIRSVKSVTSDPNRALAEQLARDSIADKINAERNQALTQLIGEHKNRMLGLKQQYANQRTQIENENKNRWYNGLAQLDMLEASRLGQQAQNKKGFLYQLRQDYATDLNEALNIKEKLSSTNANTQYYNQINELFKSKGGFNTMTPEEQETFGNNWMAFSEYKWADEISNIKNKLIFDNYKSVINDPLRQRSPLTRLFGNNVDIKPILTEKPLSTPKINIFNNKKGGRLQRFRNIDEQLFLDQQKAANKAINDLNNNIIKLFTKMMS